MPCRSIPRFSSAAPGIRGSAPGRVAGCSRGPGLRATVLVCCLLAAVAAPAAAAHTGELKTVVAAGPYRLVVQAAPVAAGAHAALSFRSTLADRRTGAPVDKARVAVRVADRSGTPLGVYRTTAAAGAYDVLIPIPSPDGWRSLRFSVSIAGPLGTATAAYRPPDVLRRWLYEPWVLAGAALAGALFLQAFVRLRRRGRGDYASWGRLALFGAGLTLIVLALVSPVDALGDRFLLSAHMLQHVLIGDAAPALLMLGVRGPLVFFLIPPALLRPLARARAVRHAAGWLQRPRVAVGAWALAFGGWHIPPVYDYAARHQPVHDLEHASFATAGLLVWALLIDPARRRRLTRGELLRVAAVVFLVGTVVSDTLIFSLQPLYPLYSDQVERFFGLSPVRDQQLAGLVMAVEQLLTFGTFAAFVLWSGRRRRLPEVAAFAGREQPA